MPPLASKNPFKRDKYNVLHLVKKTNIQSKHIAKWPAWFTISMFVILTLWFVFLSAFQQMLSEVNRPQRLIYNTYPELPELPSNLIPM